MHSGGYFKDFTTKMSKTKESRREKEEKTISPVGKLLKQERD